MAIIALPLSIALALASGVSPEQGVYTAIVAGFVISALGGSKVQIAGPTAAFATIVAGIVAASTMDTLEVEFLFVEESCRGQGLGRLLLEQAENLARQDGCKRVLLNTYSFQAPGFYRRMGYELLAQQNPCFGAYSQYYFTKNL